MGCFGQLFDVPGGEVFDLNCNLLILASTLGLPSNIDLSERAPRAWRSDPQTDIGRKDIFCLVKAEMSDMKLSQDPLLVWPGVLQRQSDQLLQVANSTTLLDKPSLDDERRNDVKRLIEAMKRDYPDMRRAINWYQSVLDRDANHSEAYTTLTFLRNVPDDGPSVHDFRLGAPPPRPPPHNLQVVFHRRPL